MGNFHAAKENPHSMARILIVDDSNSIRAQLRKLVERNPTWQVCGEASNGREAIDKTLSCSPDIVLLDYRLPVLNGLQVGREISGLAPEVRILLCSMHSSPELSEAARDAGIHGAVSKWDTRQILDAIEALLRFQTFFEYLDGQWPVETGN